MLMRENAPLCLALELSRPVLRAPCRKLCIIMLPEYMIHRAPVIMQIPPFSRLAIMLYTICFLNSFKRQTKRLFVGLSKQC